MTHENKELLFKDICARLPYGVKICYIYNGEECISTIEKIDAFGYIWDNYNGCYHIKEIKPYLFPLSSMSDEQLPYYITTLKYSKETNGMVETPNSFDLYNKNHFDYRGLIPMGLALDATGINIY